MFEKKWRFWAFVVGIWMLLGILSSINLYYIEEQDGAVINWFTAFVWGMPDMLIWALFTPVIAHLLTRFPLEKSVWPKSLFALIGISLSLPLLHGVIDASFNATIYWLAGYSFSFGHNFSAHLTYEYFQHVIICWLVISFFTGLRLYEQNKERELRTAQLESQLSQAQLHSLRMQLNPHFLFNTLNTISALVEHQPRIARRVLASLGELLRSSLDQHQHLTVTLNEELEFITRYLEIEGIRLGDRLNVAYEIEAQAREMSVPNFILQPLVENAVHHGISSRVSLGQIEISARVERGSLILTVRDNGDGFESSNGRGYREGIGLKNTRERLQKIYGESAQFSLRRTQTGWTEAQILIPIGDLQKSTSVLPEERHERV